MALTQNNCRRDRYFQLSVRLCAPNNSAHTTDFREMWYWALLLDFVDKFEIWLKSEKNSRHLHEDLHRFLPVLCEILAEAKEIVDCTHTLSSGLLVGNSPASEFYMPTFRNTLSVPTLSPSFLLAHTIFRANPFSSISTPTCSTLFQYKYPNVLNPFPV